jgi:hypothetical protein
MPKVQDPKGGGTNKDGTKSDKYCSHCYEKGAFRDEFTDVSQMLNLVRGMLKKMGYGPIKRWLYTAYIPRLERWQK